MFTYSFIQYTICYFEFDMISSSYILVTITIVTHRFYFLENFKKHVYFTSRMARIFDRNVEICRYKVLEVKKLCIIIKLFFKYIK